MAGGVLNFIKSTILNKYVLIGVGTFTGVTILIILIWILTSWIISYRSKKILENNKNNKLADVIGDYSYRVGSDQIIGKIYLKDKKESLEENVKKNSTKRKTSQNIDSSIKENKESSEVFYFILIYFRKVKEGLDYMFIRIRLPLMNLFYPDLKKKKGIEKLMEMLLGIILVKIQIKAVLQSKTLEYIIKN